MAISQEQFNQKMLEDLLAIQNKAELKMLEKVAKRVAKGTKTEGWNENKLSDIQAMRKEIEAILADKDKLSKVWTSKNLMKSYDNAGKQVSKKLHQPHSAMKDIVPLRLQRLILETNNSISGTSFRILRNTMDVYREVVSESTSGVLIGTDTRLQASQQMLNDFAAKGITGFTDKIGRNWELASYVEMATRTANSRAALQGHVDRSLELDQDLMMVSGHAATCPICAPWGNRVISITGKTPNYPTLADAQADGLFHPNCKHTLTVWFPDLEGNVEHAEQYTEKPDIEKYNAIQKQRYNERKIREAKRLQAVAITPEAKVKASNRINKWQAIQREHVKEFDLRRKYTREGITNRIGDASKATVKQTIPSPILPIAKDIISTTGPSEPQVKWENNDGSFKKLSNDELVKMSFSKQMEYLKAESKYEDEQINNLVKVPLTFEDLTDKIEDLEAKIKASTTYKDLIAMDKELIATKAELAKLMPPVKQVKATEDWIDDKGNFKQLGGKWLANAPMDKFNEYLEALKKHEADQNKALSNPVATTPKAKAKISVNINADHALANQINSQLAEQSNNWSKYRNQYNKHFDKWDTTVQVSEKKAVKEYTGSGYRRMNDALRGIDTMPSDGTLKLIEKCSNALSKASLDEDMIVRRGTSTTGLAGMFGERDIARNNKKDWLNDIESLVGRIAKDEGFLSTSPEITGGFTSQEVEIKILLPKGTQALYVEQLSNFSSEKEVLVQKGYTYEVVKAELEDDMFTVHTGNKKPVIYMKAIPFK